MEFEYMKTSGALKFIRLRKTKHLLIEPHIIKLQVNEGEFIEVADIEKMHEANLELADGAFFCVLLDTSMGYFNTSTEARDLVASKEYAKVMKATAIVVKTLATQLAGNFFIKLSKPNAPTRLFANENDALNWLHKYAK